jgi:hypothetical protein
MPADLLGHHAQSERMLNMRGLNEEHSEASASERMRCATSLCVGIPPWVASSRIAAVLEPYSTPGPMVNTPHPIPPKIRDLGDHLRLKTHWTQKLIGGASGRFPTIGRFARAWWGFPVCHSPGTSTRTVPAARPLPAFAAGQPAAVTSYFRQTGVRSGTTSERTDRCDISRSSRICLRGRNVCWAVSQGGT